MICLPQVLHDANSASTYQNNTLATNMVQAPEPGIMRSKTEPSTPIRSIVTVPAVLVNHSAPLRPRISPVHLPPQELLLVISGMSLRQQSITPEEQQTWRSGANSRRSSYNISRPTSQSHTPTKRRLSDHLTIRRRRRSSAGVEYDAGYIGPVTRGFLRAFSRVLLGENHDSEDEVYKALDEKHQWQLTSPEDVNNDFDYSLPLPDEDVMRSPYVHEPKIETQSADKQETAFTESINKNNKTDSKSSTKPVFKSYLERILERQNKKKNHLSFFDRDAELSSHVNAVIDTSKFVIENTLSGLPEYSTPHALSLDPRLGEPVAFSSMNAMTESSDSSEKEILPQPHIRKRSFLEEAMSTPPLAFSDMVPQWGSVSKMVSPTLETPLGGMEEPIIGTTDNTSDQGINHMAMNYNENMDYNGNMAKMNKDPDFNIDYKSFDYNGMDKNENIMSDDLALGLVMGHFTIDNDDIDEFHLQPALGSDTPTTVPQKRVLGPSVAIKRRRSESLNNMPKSLVRGLVSLARQVPSQKSLRQKKQSDRIPPAVLQLIAAKSNEFLQQVMLDLGAYAGHRDSNQITIQDAVLYLNRIRSYGQQASTVDNISVLAQSVFPLELLVSLDNSLQESANKRARRQNRNTEDPLYEIPLSSDSSESLEKKSGTLDPDWK